jgi:hypothetical protein
MNDTRYYGFKVIKGVNPTVTKNGTWLVTNCSQPSIASQAWSGISVTTTVTALGAFNYNNNVVGAGITLEANP